MNTLMPHISIHPGEVLKDELLVRGITQKKFAQILDTPYTMLNEILNAKRPISAELALMLEAALDIKAYIWVNMQAEYTLQMARNDSRNIRHFEAIHKACASVLL